MHARAPAGFSEQRLTDSLASPLKGLLVSFEGLSAFSLFKGKGWLLTCLLTSDRVHLFSFALRVARLAGWIV